MVKTRKNTWFIVTALILAALVAGLAFNASVKAQKSSPSLTEDGAQTSSNPMMSAGISSPTTSDCFSAAHHAASDCDRLASQVTIQPVGPTSANCYSAAFHAASDCDRLASDRYNALTSR